MKTKNELEEEKEILQDLYDEGMIDFEGDEEDLTMQVPINIVGTGKFVVDVYKKGVKKAKQRFLELIKESRGLFVTDGSWTFFNQKVEEKF